ncbi:hypothetical protein HPP92_027574, partial [Vanilla planifolia]
VERSLLVTGFGYEHDDAWATNMNLFKHFTDISRGVRRLGAASVDMSHVALGIAEAYWEYRLKPWDMAAGVLYSVAKNAESSTGALNQGMTSNDTAFLVPHLWVGGIRALSLLMWKADWWLWWDVVEIVMEVEMVELDHLEEKMSYDHP